MGWISSKTADKAHKAPRNPQAEQVQTPDAQRGKHPKNRLSNMTFVTSSRESAKLYTETLDILRLICYHISNQGTAPPETVQKEKERHGRHKQQGLNSKDSTARPQPKADYNGWKNRSTWNVSLWLNNDEELYNAARRAKVNGLSSYAAIIFALGLAHDKTPDGIAWISQELDFPALNEMIAEL